MLDHGNVGHDHMVAGAEVGRHAGKHARTQSLVSVLADDFDGEGVGGRVNGWVDEVHLTCEGLSGVRLHGDVEGHVFADVGEQAFRHVDEHLDGLDLLHDEDGHLHTVHVALVVIAGGYHTVDGATEVGVLG